MPTKLQVVPRGAQLEVLWASVSFDASTDECGDLKVGKSAVLPFQTSGGVRIPHMVHVRLCLIGVVALAACNNACSDLINSRSGQGKQQVQQPCTARYVPVGNNPEIALDTQTGMLCRTIADTNDPLGIFDPACGVSEQEKKLGWVPKGCKSETTWVKGEGDKSPSRYTHLPMCQKVIVVTEEDM